MRLSLVTYLVRDYDAAIGWLADGLGWIILEDSDLGGGKRWVRMAAHENAETAFLVARARTDAEIFAVGAANAGRVSFFLEVADFEASAERLRQHGALFEETPRQEAYGRVAVFRDPSGYRWDLICPATR